MTRIHLVRAGTSQIVRLPEEVAFPACVREVTILRDGARRVVVPADTVWDDFFDAPGIDLGDRCQSELPPRDKF